MEDFEQHNFMEISVIIPLYNKKDVVIRALNSIFCQTYLPSEIIVVNDGSTDGSELLVMSLCHPLVQIVNQKNEGVSAARNKGIELARSEWVAFLDADDFWEDEFLETIVALRNKFNPEVIGTNYFKTVNDNRKIDRLRKMNITESGVLDNYFQVASSSKPPLNSSAMACKKTSIIRVGMFPVGIKSGEDLLTWAKLACEFRIAYCLTPLSNYIISEEDEIGDKPKRINEEIDNVAHELIQLRKKHKKTYISNYISHWYIMKASVFLRVRYKKKALYQIIKALYFNPLSFKAYVFLFLVFMPSKLFFYLQKSLKS